MNSVAFAGNMTSQIQDKIQQFEGMSILMIKSLKNEVLKKGPWLTNKVRHSRLSQKFCEWKRLCDYALMIEAFANKGVHD